MDNLHYVFSQAFPWGAVVSFARLGDFRQTPVLVSQRAAKATLGALVKSFGVMSSDPNCVTSFSRSLPEFDAKGNRPSPESLARFRQQLQRRDAAWAAHVTPSPGRE